MLYSALAFLAGISAFQFIAELPDWQVCWLLLPLAPLLTRRYLRGTGYLVVGFLWAWWHAAQLLQLHLPDQLEGRDLHVEGRVTAIPETLSHGALRFRFSISRYHDGERWKDLNLPVLLNWYRQAGELRTGEHWSLRIRLKKPHGFANPGGFDYTRWLFSERIRATGYVRSGRSSHRLQTSDREPLTQLRIGLANYLVEHAGQHGRAEFLKALSIGLRDDISDDQWQVLRRTGTSHLIAISGLHVGLVAGLVFFLARRGWAGLGLSERWPAPSAAAVAAMVTALGYALLAGFEVPAQRATVMVWVWMLARLGGTRTSPWRVWSIALWLVLLWNPLTVLSPGFWLSFGAVAWILYLSAGRHDDRPKWRRSIGVQTALVIGLTPILWLSFQRVSLVAPLANLFAIPWVGLLVVPMLLIAALCIPLWPAAADWLLWLASVLLNLLWTLLEALAALPFSELALSGLSGPLLLVFGLGLLCCLSVRALPLHLLGLVLLAPALWHKSPGPKTGELWFTLLDVGQGLAAVAETHNHVLVYDTGPAFPSGFNTGDAVVVPFLLQRGYRQLDRLVISHADNDHRGGGAALLAALDVYSVHSGEPQALDGIVARHCTKGRRWEWDGVSFEYLGPAGRRQGNNASCVLRIETADGRALLLPGDIERGIERELLATAPERLAATVLVAPHHGSGTSSTTAFVDAVRPRYALFATGYRNRFGFPKPAVSARYRRAGARLLDTAREGAIQLRLEGGKPAAVNRYRTQSARYWH